MPWVCQETLRHFKAFETHLEDFFQLLDEKDNFVNNNLPVSKPISRKWVQANPLEDEEEDKYKKNLTIAYKNAVKFLYSEKPPASVDKDNGLNIHLLTISASIKIQLIELQKILLSKTMKFDRQAKLMSKHLLVFEFAIKFVDACTNLDIMPLMKDEMQKFQVQRRKSEEEELAKLNDLPVQKVSYFSIFKHAVSYYPKTMITSGINLTLGLGYSVFYSLDTYVGKAMNDYLHSDETGVTHQAVFIASFLLLGIGLGTGALIKSCPKNQQRDAEIGISEDEENVALLTRNRY